jgi:hypothetical protein
MTKVLSTRLDERVIDELERATRALHISKKQFLEEAIRLRAAQTTREERLRIVRETAGAWQRDESPEETIENIRRESREAWERRQAYFDSLGPQA